MNIQVEMITTARRIRCIVKIKSENDYDVLYDLLVGKTTTWLLKAGLLEYFYTHQSDTSAQNFRTTKRECPSCSPSVVIR